MIIDEFLVNLVKIIDENSSNLINQQLLKLLRIAEFWSIHDRDWSSFKLEQKHNFTDLSAFSLQQVWALIHSNNHQSSQTDSAQFLLILSLSVSQFFHFSLNFHCIISFLRTLTQFISVCQDSDQIWHYKSLFCFVLCFVEKSLHFIHCKLCDIQIKQLLMNS